LLLASAGQKAVEDAWVLLDEVVSEAKLATPIHRFTGYAGLSTREQLEEHLANNRLRLEGGLAVERTLIAREWDTALHIAKEYEGLYELAPHEDVLALLETSQQEYVIAVAEQKGCANSALLCEELAGYLLATYPARFTLHEETSAKEIQLRELGATIVCGEHAISASRVVLATNGFENFTISNAHGEDIDTEFHHVVSGLIGYMAGYLEADAATPTAVSYYPTNYKRTEDPMGDSYFYLTRRPFEHEGREAETLVCVGGVDKRLPSLALYSRAHGCDEEKREELKSFLEKSYLDYPIGGTDFAFCWHGLMGYTPNRVRRVGVEPHNPVLLYNLGCNGVGLLPSIMGGKRIAQILAGAVVEPSIFDPARQ
jgi:glycine/D-amino acid oxidase-like deaminating enzyme